MCHVPENCTIPLYPKAAAATLYLVDKVVVVHKLVHTQVVCPSTVNYFLSIFKGILLNLSFGRGIHEQIENHMSSLVLIKLSTCEEEVVVTLHKFSKLLIPLTLSLSLSLSLSLYIYIYI
jgi:hypothetical protein